MNPYTYKVKSVDRVVDGDTVDVTLDLGFHLFIMCRIRMKGFDAPETYRPQTKQEEQAGIQVQQFVENLLRRDSPLYVQTGKETGSFGRWLGIFFSEVDDTGIRNLNEAVDVYMAKHQLHKQDFRVDNND